MSNDKSKPAQTPPKSAGKPEAKQTAPPVGSKNPPPLKGPAAPIIVPKLFRRWDWITFWLTTLVVFVGYFYTLAPDLTLEDSGELAVASYYAGVPHPPGYPVWTIYTWIFTWLFPFSNIAWRVGLSSAVAGAFACGLVGLLVSRGSSMLMEGIGTLKDVEAKYEHWINLVAGFVAGMLLGYNGFMWSQAVIVEVYTLSVLSLVLVLCFLLRWMYAPQQRKYLYWAGFMFGICLNNHQTLVVAAMGIEILVLAVQPRLGRNLLIVNTVIYFAVLVLRAKGQVVFMNDNPVLFGIFNAVGISSALGALYLAAKTKDMLADWAPVIIMGGLFAVGMAFYFYMPIAGMTNPPLNWGYPRTETGFWHAFTRGQYDKTNPVNPFSFRFIEQVAMVIEGAIEEFNFINLMIGLLPFLFYKRMLKRDRAWLVGLTAIYLFLAFLLLILLNPNTDMQSREQSRVFFAASHVVIAIAIGYGIAIIGTLVATEYEKIRVYLLGSAAVASAIALYNLVALDSDFALDRYNAAFLLALTLLVTAGFIVSKVRMPLQLILVVFAILPLNSVFAHWSDNEQRGHYFGYWFGHDMFTPPYKLYPEMEKNAILFGGTDPGRFNPTYMIFCESFIPPSKKPRDPKFDRRDVYLITQNALADGTYLDYIRAHYNRSAQKDPYFFVNFFRTTNEEELGRTNLFAKMMVPIDRMFTRLGAKIEKRRRAEGVYPPQENPTVPPPEARDLIIGGEPYDVGGYLSKEIITPSPEDSQQAFAEYIQDAQRRLQHDMANPNAPKQIKPGEDVRVVDNRISVSGQVAVMAINALLTKIIFEKNPTNEFYVEESFPLDWMFPYLTPYGIIMKINRNPVPEFTDDIIRKDHEFWSQYSERLIGNWITYDTPVKEVCDFAERVYKRRDYTGFKGSKEFVRDDNAQKAFSKLRSAIGGVYFWRVQNNKNPAEYARALKEAEFAFKQSFAYCPFSPEAVFKYVTLLVNVGRAGDADLVVKTCLLWDPENLGIQSLAENVRQILQSQPQRPQMQSGAQAPIPQGPDVSALEAKYQQDPSNLTNAFSLASAYFGARRSNDGFRVLQALIDRTNASAQAVLSVAKAYSDLGHVGGLEHAFARATEVLPNSPETWYDLARVQVALNKKEAALSNLQKAVQLSNERAAKDSNAFNVAKDARTNKNFDPIRTDANFQKVVGM
jgi:tetratricopeptide (TPR) repeat protein